MTPAGFEHMARMYLIESFKSRLGEFKKKYDDIQEKFNTLCDELDRNVINESYLQEVSTHMTIYLSEMDLLDLKMQEISEIIERITSELSN
jgi:hypothetical protein